MANEAPQNFTNHGRWDPLFHFFAVPVFAITLILAIIYLIKYPGWHSAWMLVFLSALTVALFKIRLYPLKVQDRLIRLEERLRLATLVDPSLRARIEELTESQLVALRFASDPELAALAARALNEKLSATDIKKAIQRWRPDNWRV
jgi:Family of unknown function (DUF6526)